MNVINIPYVGVQGAMPLLAHGRGVVPFPATGERFTISRSGGPQPTWRTDGCLSGKASWLPQPLAEARRQLTNWDLGGRGRECLFGAARSDHPRFA